MPSELPPTIAAAAPLRLHPRMWSPLLPMAKCSPWLWPPSIQCYAVTWSEQDWSICLAQAKVHDEAQETWQLLEKSSLGPLCPALGAKQHTCTLHEQSPGFHSPHASPSRTPASQGGSSLLCRTPRLGHPICGSHCLLPSVGLQPCILPFPLSAHSGAQVPTCLLFFPSYSITCESFLQP